MASGDDQICIACAAEGEYVVHGAAMLASAFASCSDKVDVVYLHGPRFSASNKGKLAAMAESAGAGVRFLEIPDHKMTSLPVRGFTLKATWYRIFLPELMPQLDRIIYLDSDLLVLDDLLPLWQLEMGDQLVGAVTNVFQADWIGRAHQLKIPPKRYFNAGVLVMNLDGMRRVGATEALLEYGRENTEGLVLRDQDALNVVLGSRRLDLHPRWNCMNSILRFPAAEEVFGAAAVEEARRNPAIRHFEGPGANKPWHPECDREMRELYARHRLATPWPAVRVSRAGRIAARLRRLVRP